MLKKTKTYKALQKRYASEYQKLNKFIYKKNLKFSLINSTYCLKSAIK